VLQTEIRDRAKSPERACIIEALIEVAAERGYLNTSVEAILDRAALDRAAFDRHFRGKYDCFLSAWQEINEECMEAILYAYNSQQDWPDRLRAVACEVVQSLRQDPSRASFAVEVLAAGDAARARRDMTIRVVASLIDAGRNEMGDPGSIPYTTAEALAGSVYGQIYSKVIGGTVDELPRLVPQLMAAVVMPYLGMDAAIEELARREPAPAGGYRRHVEEPPVSEEEPNVPEERRSNGAREGGNPAPGSPEPDIPSDSYPPELSRLPSGRHGLPREFVAHNQRERLVAGLAEAVAEHGYSDTTIAHITRNAAVSRRTFYEHFASKDECFVAAYEVVMGQLHDRIAEGFEEAEDWPHAIEAGIAAMLRFLAAEPALARLAMVEAMVAGPVVIERYDAAIQSFVPYFRVGREDLSPEVLGHLSPSAEEALVGGMISLISRRILAGEAVELESLLPDLVEFTLTPYLGSAEAAKIAKRQ
jgi:AcrR family transcriptional regulator